MVRGRRRSGGLLNGAGERRLAWIAAAALASTSVAACTKYEREKLELAIVGAQKSKQWPLSRVTCPPEVELRKGDTFTCQIHFSDGQQVDAEVLQEDDGGNFSWQVKSRVSLMGEVTDRVTRQLPASAAGAEVSCGERAVLVVRKGEQLSCTAKTATQTLELDVRVEDDEGKLAIKAKP